MNKLATIIPKTTTPLTKFVRTAEGWLIIAFNGVVLLATLFGSLPNTQALKWAGVVNTATVLARSGLKAIAAFSKGSGLTPIEPGGTPTELGGLPADNTSAEATLSDKPQSGVTPDPGQAMGETSTPIGGIGTGPAPGANIPGARRRKS